MPNAGENRYDLYTIIVTLLLHRLYTKNSSSQIFRRYAIAANPCPFFQTQNFRVLRKPLHVKGLRSVAPQAVVFNILDKLLRGRAWPARF